MYKRTHLFFFLTVAVFFNATRCKKPDDQPFKPKPQTDHEIITGIKLTFEDVNDVAPDVVVQFSDPDGVGGNNPIQFDTIRLLAQTTYSVVIQLYNESVSPIKEVTENIRNLGSEHLFCFSPTGVSIAISLTDSDGTYPIGFSSNWVIGNAGIGNLQVRLKHQTSGKDGTCNPGSTDVEVNFRTEIQ
jgi:hypothetical protein